MTTCIENGTIPHGPTYHAPHGAGQATVMRAPLFAEGGIVTPDIKGHDLTLRAHQNVHIRAHNGHVKINGHNAATEQHIAALEARILALETFMAGIISGPTPP